MIEINLSPGAATRRAPKRREAAMQMPKMPAFSADVRMVGLGALGLLLVLLAGYVIWQLGIKRTSLEARIAQEVTDSTRYATTIALIQTLQARQDTVARKIEVIRGVDQRRFVWPHLLDEISRSVPPYTWLTEISSMQAPSAPAPADGTAPAPSGPMFTLQGNAGSTQALTRLMKNLEGSPFIRDVTLVTSNQTLVEGRAIHRFTLEARFEEPDSSAIETLPILVVN